MKNILGFSPDNLFLYKQAFRHSSSSTENTEHLQSNERLEFLGDAVLGVVVADYLFKLFPKKNEGFLTQMRSRIVNGQNLYALSKKFGFDILLQARTSNKDKLSASACGDVFEAFIGALYVDKGFQVTRRFILDRVIKMHLDIDILLKLDTDYKSQFQVLMQQQKKQFAYTVIKEEYDGPHKIYAVQLSINGVEQAIFEHRSKKVAEQKVAQLVLEKLAINI